MSFWTRIFGVTRRKDRYQNDLTFKESLLALKSIPQFLKMIWQTSKPMAAGNIVLRIASAGLPVAVLYVAKLIIDEVIRLSQLEGGYADADMSYMWTIVAIELGLVLFSSLLNRIVRLLDDLLGDLFANESSVRLIEHAAALDLPQFEDAGFYDKLERARRQTSNRVIMMSQILKQFQDAITIVFLAAGLVWFNPWLIVILVIAVLPVFLSETYFNQHSYSIARNWTAERRELDYLRLIGASDQTAKEIKIFGLQDFVKDRFKTLADKYYEVNKNLAIRKAFWGFIFNGLGDVGYYIAYVFIIMQTVNGQISVGDLTFLAGSFNRLRNLLQGILQRFSFIAQSALYLKDFFDFFEIKPTIISKENALKIPSQIKEGFVFENVGFQYPNTDKWAIRNVSFTLKAGEKLALVGENGAGKTTLVKLLARLYDPSEGRILLDGRDIKDYHLVAYRQIIGVIFQDFVRFNLKVNENIAIGKIDERANHPKIKTAAHQSLADAVIEKLPAKYEQMLGRRFEKGVELSGGEWQKVALGRAYMRDAQLLILDEPTAALDARAEYEVFERFTDLTQGKTAVIISHRFSTVRMADRILVLRNGEKLELGSHEELMAEGGLYAELFNLQAQGYK